MNEKIYKTGLMNDPDLTDRRDHCTGNGNRNRDHDDRKRCKTAEKEIRDIDIKGFRNRRKH